MEKLNAISMNGTLEKKKQSMKMKNEAIEMSQ